MQRKNAKAAKVPKAAAGRTPPPLSVVILAAGQGTRMLSNIPKVLQPLAGEPLLSHVLTLAQSLTPASVHVVYGHGGEQVPERFAGASVVWTRQDQQLGTGHAVQQALPKIANDQRVLVLYGDVPLLTQATLTQLSSLAHARNLVLLTASLPDPRGYGRVVRSAAGKAQRIVEQSDASPREQRIREINTGVMIAPASLLKSWLKQLQPRNAQGEYYLTDIVGMAARQKIAIDTLEVTDVAEVQGINDRQQLASAEAEYRRRRAQQLMRAGVTLVDPLRIDIRGEVTVGRDVLLDVNVVLEGPIHLADGVHIGPNCVLRSAQVGANTVLYSNCVIQDAQIGSQCQIGPFTRVRPRSTLADGVHLGNFVEIKNSDVGPGSKVNHLSYVGDATVGTKVNVGAGTITCNYDGANKWRTEIGNDTFIGSGAMLVAPVKIGDGATIAAGSTITEDAPAGKLTLARSRQVTIEQWQRPQKARAKS